MYVCVCVCVCVCVYVRIYVCVYACMYYRKKEKIILKNQLKLHV